MKNYIQRGDNINYVVPSGVTISSGDIVNVGPALSGVAFNDGVEGDTIVVGIKGVYELPKTGSLEILAGTEVYVNTSTGAVSKTISHKPLGIAVEDSLTAATVVKVLIDGKRGENVPNEAQAAVIAALGTTTNLPATGAVLATAAGTTYSDAAVITAIDGAVTALRTPVEARLDAAEAKIDALLAALKTANLMASA